MNLSRWDIKRLMRALDTAIHYHREVIESNTPLIPGHQELRLIVARSRRELAFSEGFKRDLALLLANWPKNRRIEL